MSKTCNSIKGNYESIIMHTIMDDCIYYRVSSRNYSYN